MRIVILTEDEPFHSSDSFRHLFEILPNEFNVVLTVIAEFSPDGPSASRIATSFNIIRVFGMLPFLHAVWRYARFGRAKTRQLEALFREKKSVVVSGVRDVNAEEILSSIRQAEPDLIVSVTMHHLFGPELLGLAPCLNLHLSLLPNHRGLMPVFWALHAGDSETGVTVHIVDEKIDNGDILVQKRVPILSRRLDPLYRELKFEGMGALANAISLISGNEIVKETKDLSRSENIAERSARGVPERKDVRSFLASGNHLF